VKLSKLAKLRILRVLGVATGAGLASAGALLVAGAPPAAVWVSALGAAIMAAATGINLGEFNAAPAGDIVVPAAQAGYLRARAAAAEQRPPGPGEPMGFARLGVLVVILWVCVLGAMAVAGCGPGGGVSPAAPPPYDGAVAPGGTVSLAALVATPSGGQPVTWSVDPGGGSITQAGAYTAPGCPELLAALGGQDVTQVGAISAEDVVRASWRGGELAITVRLQEAILGIEVLPTEVDVEPGGQVQFRALVHYTCHTQG